MPLFKGYVKIHGKQKTNTKVSTSQDRIDVSAMGMINKSNFTSFTFRGC
jgi:hypothetical protein